MNKNNKLHIPITTEEKVKLQRKADLVGLTLSSYCRLVLLTTNPKMQRIFD